MSLIHLFIKQILSFSAKEVLTHKPVIKHKLMNKLPYVNKKHKNLFLLLHYHLTITILTSHSQIVIQCTSYAPYVCNRYQK